jgi:hypothetical protein
MAELNWPLPVEQMLECATEFLAADRRKFSDGPVVVRKMPQRDGSVKWAVYIIPRLCLSKGGFWEYEPVPSNREDAWLAEHRFDTFADEWAAAEKVLESE